MKRNEARVTKIQVDHPPEAPRVSLDAQWTIVVDAVLIQILIRADIERQTAVGLEDDTDLIVVDQCRTKPTPAPGRREHRGERKRVRLVEGRHAFVAVDIRWVRKAIVLTSDHVC